MNIPKELTNNVLKENSKRVFVAKPIKEIEIPYFTYYSPKLGIERRCNILNRILKSPLKIASTNGEIVKRGRIVLKNNKKESYYAPKWFNPIKRKETTNKMALWFFDYKMKNLKYE